MEYTYPYPRPAVTVDTLVFNYFHSQWHVLLIQRKYEPFKDQWALPGGFIELNETLLEACIRELEEETNISGLELKQFYTFDALNRDPRHRTISTVFACTIQNAYLPIKAKDDALNINWFSINNLPNLAFDHNDIIKKGIIELLKQP